MTALDPRDPEYQRAKQAEADKANRRLAAKEKTWGDVMWKHIRNGAPREEAAFRADEWDRRQKRRNP